jgi:hypothetical protein
MSNTGIVNIRGKEYQTVALRVQKFREQHPGWSLTSEVLFRDVECVVMKSIIADETGRVLATGHAEEYRNTSQINGTSALENAETSAHGRSLAALGIGGTEFASANEVQNAIQQQAKPTAKKEELRKPKSREEILKAINDASTLEMLSIFWGTLTPEECNLVLKEATAKKAQLKGGANA